MPQALSQLISAVERADSASALSDAVQDLADAGLVEAAPHLIEALSYNNPGAAVAAVDGLVQLGESTVPALLEQLDLNNYTARAWAIRALASIGDPRGLLTLLGAATADISMSVRRAAARGLGKMQWHQFPQHFLAIAQSEALEALLFVAQQDEEWIVRYAGVVGLESLALASQTSDNARRSQIQSQLDHMAAQESSPSVRARIWKAQHCLRAETPPLSVLSTPEPSPLSSTDWEQILKRLYDRKLKERSTIETEEPIAYRDLLSTRPQ